MDATAQGDRNRQSAWVLGTTALAGAIAGVLIVLLGDLVSAAGPEGDGWSLRGNGAFIVPFGVGPAVLAAGWTMLVLHARYHSRWILLGLASGLLELAIVAASLVPLFVRGSAAGATAGSIAQPLQLLWLVGSPVLAARLPISAHPQTRVPGWHFAAGVVLPFALIFGAMAGLFLRT
jgi:hypothetical protein